MIGGLSLWILHCFPETHFATMFQELGGLLVDSDVVGIRVYPSPVSIVFRHLFGDIS